MALWPAPDCKHLHIIVGMMRRKDVAGFLAPLTPYLASVMGVGMGGNPLAHDRGTFTESLSGMKINVKWAGSVSDAVRMLSAGGCPPSRFLIPGSLYLMKDVLQ